MSRPGSTTTRPAAPPQIGGPVEGPDREVTAVVIGAGPAGLAAAKALVDRGIPFAWFEQGSMVGGLWQIDNDTAGGLAAYDSLHLNSSRTRTEFPSFPMPADWPDYPSHRLVARYFDDFADHFDLRRRITFRTPVTRVEPVPGPGDPGAAGWTVTTGDGQRIRTAHVLVGTGHHSTPNLPTFPGTFTGTSFHAHDYREPSVFVGRDVLVLGVGNSGMDLACDAAHVARRVFLATRHGVHVLPKYAFGRPIDHFATMANAYLPFPVERALYELVLRASTGRPQDRGLPKPDHRLLGAHPTVSAELYDRVGHGDIEIKPTIIRLDGDHVEFADGSREHVDVLVYATGYRVTLPFLDPAIVDPAGNELRLYQRVVAPDRPGLWFVGFVQTVGSNIPLMEYQAQWVGDLITGSCELPPADEMRRWIERDRAAMQARYVRSQRHTMQVDFWRYVRALKEARARRPGQGLVGRLTRPLAALR